MPLKTESLGVLDFFKTRLVGQQLRSISIQVASINWFAREIRHCINVLCFRPDSLKLFLCHTIRWRYYYRNQTSLQSRNTFARARVVVSGFTRQFARRRHTHRYISTPRHSPILPERHLFGCRRCAKRVSGRVG